MISNWIDSSQRTQIVQHWLFKSWDLYYSPAYFISYRERVLNSPTMIMEGPFLSSTLSIFASSNWSSVINVFLMTLSSLWKVCLDVLLLIQAFQPSYAYRLYCTSSPSLYSPIYLEISISTVLCRQYRVGSWVFHLFWQFLSFNWNV